MGDNHAPPWLCPHILTVMGQEESTVLPPPLPSCPDSMDIQKSFLKPFFPPFSYSKALFANPFVFQLQGTPHLEGTAWQMRGNFRAEISG